MAVPCENVIRDRFSVVSFLPSVVSLQFSVTGWALLRARLSWYDLKLKTGHRPLITATL